MIYFGYSRKHSRVQAQALKPEWYLQATDVYDWNGRTTGFSPSNKEQKGRQRLGADLPFDLSLARFQPHKSISSHPSTGASIMAEAVIIDAVRTPIGRNKARCARRVPINCWRTHWKAWSNAPPRQSQIADVIIGCVGQVGEQGMNIARRTALLADFRLKCRRSAQSLCSSRSKLFILRAAIARAITTTSSLARRESDARANGQ